jgi:hypothetical protein
MKDSFRQKGAPKYRTVGHPTKQKLISLALICLLMPILATAFHYENVNPRLSGCVICQIKSSTSLSLQKNISDSFVGLPSCAAGPLEFLQTLPESAIDNIHAFVPFLISFSLANKSPPIQI